MKGDDGVLDRLLGFLDSERGKIVLGVLGALAVITIVVFAIVYSVVNDCYQGKYLYTYHGIHCSTTGGKHPITYCYPVSYPVYQTICKGDKDYRKDHSNAGR